MVWVRVVIIDHAHEIELASEEDYQRDKYQKLMGTFS
jgi:hypothetical protein